MRVAFVNAMDLAGMMIERGQSIMPSSSTESSRHVQQQTLDRLAQPEAAWRRSELSSRP